jgi:hypothetical protein
MYYEGVCLAIVILVPCLLFIVLEIYKDHVERTMGPAGPDDHDIRFWL